MGDELEPISGEASKQPSRHAVERFMRVYGRDIMDAFDDLENARLHLDMGAAGLATTYAAHAIVRLRDPQRKNDADRTKLDIVMEICSVFDPRPVVNFQELLIFDEDCIVEVSRRLRCARGTAIGLLHMALEDGRPQLEAASVDDQNQIESGEDDAP